MADLSVEIAGVRFKNPVWTSSSEVTMNFEKMKLEEVDASGRPRPEPIAGSEFDIYADTAIVAVGEKADIPGQFGLKRTDGNAMWVNAETLATSREGVFAGGDMVSGPGSIIEAIAAGRRVAMSIDKYLGGKGKIDEVLAPPEGEVKPLDADKLPEERRVLQAPTMPLSKRLFSFNMVERGYTEEEAVKEAKRCLRCDANWIYTVNEENCKGCYNCKVICPVEGCINMKVVG